MADVLPFFFPQPEFRFVDDDVIELTANYRLRFGGRRWDLRRGFRSDGGSSPWGTWNLVPKFNGDTLVPFLVHDANYAGHLVTRAEADEILYEMLRANGIWWIKAQGIYWGVRAGGWVPWQRHTPVRVTQVRTLVMVTELKKEKAA